MQAGVSRRGPIGRTPVNENVCIEKRQELLPEVYNDASRPPGTVCLCAVTLIIRIRVIATLAPGPFQKGAERAGLSLRFLFLPCF